LPFELGIKNHKNGPINKLTMEWEIAWNFPILLYSQQLFEWKQKLQGWRGDPGWQFAHGL
jgi:hypothetical protein